MVTDIVTHGGGYVGLTGAVHFAMAGVKVTIYDPDPYTVDSINKGEPRAKEYLGYINQNVAELVSKGMLKATTDFESIRREKVHLLAVPTEKGDSPDMSIVKKAIADLMDTLPYGGIIIVESTLQPGTIDSLDSLLLWKLKSTDYDWHLAVAPRLDWFADSSKNVSNLPRIVGGVKPASTKKAVEVLSVICKDIHETDYQSAEWAKCGQNAAYFVQIMFAHELALRNDDVDFNEILRLISLHWRIPTLYLGPGTSGRCVQMGAQYLKAFHTKNRYLHLVEEALSIDKLWREKIGKKLTQKFTFCSDSLSVKILVMGIAYRPDFSDFGYSAGLDIAKYLKECDWDVLIHDPIVPESTLKKVTNIPFSPLNKKFDAILLATGHSTYRYLPSDETLWRKGQFVLDACGLWEMYRDTFNKYGVEYVRVGEKGWMHK